MKKVALFALALTVCLPAMAQSSGGSMSQSSGMSSAKKTPMIGCVAESNGKYMMMNKANPNGVELMTSEDLKGHVGHKMKMTGMMSADKMSMQVSSMKMMSTKCTMPKSAPMSK
jgi:hypothetical protein